MIVTTHHQAELISAGIIEHDFPVFAAELERRTGHRVTARFNPTGTVAKWLLAGEPCDVVALGARDPMQQLVEAGKVLGDTVIEFGKAVVGIAVKEGAPGFDISTPSAIRSAMLAAKAFAHGSPDAGSSSGIHVRKVIAELGITAAVAGKIVMRNRGQLTIRAVAEGLADFVVGQSTEIVAVPGVRYIGPLPESLQVQNVVCAGLTPRGVGNPAAKAVLALMGNRDMRPHWSALGLDAL